MKQSLLQAIINHLFGRKYYVVILQYLNWPTPDAPSEVCSYIFYNKDQAQQYIQQSVYGRAAGQFSVIDVVSFRSRCRLISRFNPNNHLDFSKFYNNKNL